MCGSSRRSSTAPATTEGIHPPLRHPYLWQSNANHNVDSRGSEPHGQAAWRINLNGTEWLYFTVSVRSPYRALTICVPAWVIIMTGRSWICDEQPQYGMISWCQPVKRIWRSSITRAGPHRPAQATASVVLRVGPPEMPYSSGPMSPSLQ